MSPTAALHNACRRYCIDRIAHWNRVYAALSAAGADHIRRGSSWIYTDDAYRTFPRYEVLEVILASIETFTPGDFATIADARELLAEAGRTAQGPFTRGATNPIWALAMAEEREAFVAFVDRSRPEDWATFAMLPFRRGLGKAEHLHVSEAFRARWGRWDVDRADRPIDAPYLALHVEVMDVLRGPEWALRGLLEAQGITRLCELRESGDGFEVDLEAASFAYNGLEGFWFTRALDWMIYASHEASIVFGGGWLVDALRARVPDLDRYTYRGWDQPPSARAR